MISLNLLFQFLFVFQGSQAHAACPADQQFQFKSITVAGNSKTITSVILRELNISPYQLVCQEQIDDGLNRIRRTGLFSQADYQTQEDSLLVNVNERWTTIPIVKGNSGGGVSQFTLGVYDPNIYGEFLEAGAQYENLAGASSGVLWFKNPRLFDQYQGVDLQYWNIKRIRVKYDQKSYSPLIKNGFLQEREKIYAGYFREISRDHVLRFSLDYNSDDFSTDFLSDEVNEKNGPNPILPPQSKLIISTLGYEMGRIQGETQSLEGSQLGLYIGYAQSLNSDVKSFVQGDINYQYFLRLKTDWQLAQRILVGSTTTQVLQYWHYLGGLDRIRGFADNRFSGRHYALSNSELRHLFWQRPSYLLQAAAFIDFATLGEKLADLNQIHAASVGGGIRLILPKFYRFVLRFDYARPIVKSDDMNFSLGVQQFF